MNITYVCFGTKTDTEINDLCDAPHCHFVLLCGLWISTAWSFTVVAATRAKSDLMVKRLSHDTHRLISIDFIIITILISRATLIWPVSVCESISAAMRAQIAALGPPNACCELIECQVSREQKPSSLIKIVCGICGRFCDIVYGVPCVRSVCCMVRLASDKFGYLLARQYVPQHQTLRLHASGGRRLLVRIRLIQDGTSGSSASLSVRANCQRVFAAVGRYCLWFVAVWRASNPRRGELDYHF